MYRILRLACAFAAVLAVGCGGDDFEFVGEPGAVVPVELVSDVPLVAGSFDGSSGLSFLVDTGAPFTIVDRDATTGPDGVRQAAVAAFELEFPALDTLVFDVFGGTGTGIDGIIGGDVLSHFALGIDYRGGAAWLDTRPADELPSTIDVTELGAPVSADGSIRGGGNYVVPGDCGAAGCGTVSAPASRFLIDVILEDQEAPVTMIVDTGATAVVLSESALAALGDNSRPRWRGVEVVTATGPIDTFMTRVSRVRVLGRQGEAVGETRSVAVIALPDGELLDGLSAEVGTPVAGLIGASFLRAHLVRIDYRSGVLSLAPYLETDHIADDEYAGVGFELEPSGSSWIVERVYPGTDAETVGVSVGEPVSAIDGSATSGLSRAGLEALFATHAVGETVDITLERMNGPETVAVVFENLLPPFGAS